VGLAIKPPTSVESVVKYADFVDTLLVMTVEPGFGGQKFMHDMMPKVCACVGIKRIVVLPVSKHVAERVEWNT